MWCLFERKGAKRRGSPEGYVAETGGGERSAQNPLQGGGKRCRERLRPEVPVMSSRESVEIMP